MIDVKKIEAELKKRVEKAAIHLVNKIKLNLNEPAPDRERHVTPNTVYYTVSRHADDGQFPLKITGFLQRSITYELSFDGLSAKVGSTMKGDNNYALFLELTNHPFMVPTLKKEREEIKRILTA